MIENFLNNSTGIIIISIIWGLGLAMVFSRACNGRNCIVIKGPNPNDIKNKIYNFENKCFTFTPHISKCLER